MIATSDRPTASELKQSPSAVDLALRAVDQSIRGLGYPGFETQTLVWLGGRADAPAFRRSLSELGRRHPKLTARLAAGRGNEWHWRMAPGSQVELVETELDSADSEAVYGYAEKLQSAPTDLETSPPIRFHLLRRRGGSDVLILHYSHVLLDHASAEMVLRELAQPAHSHRAAGELSTSANHALKRYLRRYSRDQRQAAAQQVIDLFGRELRGRAAILGSGSEMAPQKLRLRIAAGSLDSCAVSAVKARTLALCGLASLSMAVLAGAFRAIAQLGERRNVEGRDCIAGIGLDLGLRRGSWAPDNHLSLVPIVASPREMSDPEALVVHLARQMRQRLADRIDLGVVRLMTAFQRRPRHLEWVVEHMLRWRHSLWYACFSADGRLAHLGGTPIERINYVGPTWSPMGLSLLANSHLGRLHLQATYNPDLVPDPLAGAFLDGVLRHLRELAAR